MTQDARLRLLERASLAAPSDAMALERYDSALARFGRPTLRGAALTKIATALFETGVIRDPWKMILTPCCGRAPRWSPPAFNYDFAQSHIASCPPSYRYGIKSERLTATVTERGVMAMRDIVAPKCGRRFLEVTFRSAPSMGVSEHEFDQARQIERSRDPVDYTPPYASRYHAEIVREIIRALPDYWSAGQALRVHV